MAPEAPLEPPMEPPMEGIPEEPESPLEPPIELPMEDMADMSGRGSMQTRSWPA